MTQPHALPQPCQVRLVDGWQLRRGDERVTTPMRSQRLIAFLALQGEQSRSVVAGSLWPTSAEAQARSSLRAAVVQLRRDVPGALAVRNGSLSLDVSVSVDLHGLRTILTNVLAAPTTVLVASIANWGDLLPGWYEDWVLFERERWRHRRVMALDLMARRALETGDADVAQIAAEACVELEPLREASHRLLTQAHLSLGNRIEALRVYEDFRQRSLTEFGLAPDQRFEALIGPLLLERQRGRHSSLPRH
ncbi:BTAD domain-containing putative transcriptional regulator [Nocardioides sp. zg-1228]|uniref:AfsR/SARP family transcriptional regulator n=1 Tax=Nocardioides sp. zg-1228 TaxID=2763008 RepID=UPI00164346D2|nr:BTAD domain-containing putative transcriptional regulator [Nocardioides sp. zg-1228]MBC2932485.1 SARP family transcriptional regulator [Nocardioides sp. zg-1228]QSF57991.1 bacterial transcriptional activator domain-containing protein [Nocardioides sp. zg-1228]